MCSQNFSNNDEKSLSKNIPLSSDILFKLSAELVQLTNEKDICETVIKRLHNSLGYDYVALFLIEGVNSARNLIASAGFENPVGPLMPGQGVSEQPFIDGKLNYTSDVTKTNKYYYGSGGSEVDVPIWINNEVVGVIVAESNQKDAFAQHDFELLTAVSQITGLTLEKSQMFNQEHHRVETLEALGITMTELTGVKDLNKLLGKIVKRAVSLIGATGGELGVVNEELEEITIVVSHNLGEDFIGRKQKLDEGLMGLVAKSKKSEFIENYMEWSGKLESYQSIYSTFGVPLILGGEILGIFTTVTSDKSRKFNADDRKILNMFAQQAALAIESARLYTKSENENKEKKQLLKEVLKQKEYYEALLVNSPAAIVTADLNGKVMTWNPKAEKLFGFTSNEVVGNLLDDFVGNHPDIREEAEKFTKEVITDGQVMATTKRTRKDGFLVDVELLALPVIVLNDLMGFIAIYHDITELKAIERELRSKNETLSNQLIIAGKIQSGLIPTKLPIKRGWQISATLKPALETSGDFYSIHELTNGNLAILIADVIDKGVGAALFMSLSWSLFRMFGNEYLDDPSQVFYKTNQYILNETQINQFVTAIYGILNPETGEFTFCNAGHCPMIFINGQGKKEIMRFPASGIPIGIEKGIKWNNEKIIIQQNNMIVMYTDGIIEAENKQGDFFGEENLVHLIRGIGEKSTSETNKNILQKISLFVEGNPKLDDMAIITIKRSP